MPKSRTDIQFKVLAILTGGDVGQTPSAEDAATIDGYIDDEVDELNADGTVYISNPDELENELFTSEAVETCPEGNSTWTIWCQRL